MNRAREFIKRLKTLKSCQSEYPVGVMNAPSFRTQHHEILNVIKAAADHGAAAAGMTVVA